MLAFPTSFCTAVTWLQATPLDTDSSLSNTHPQAVFKIEVFNALQTQ
jgi:hypothetical protein